MTTGFQDYRRTRNFLDQGAAIHDETPDPYDDDIQQLAADADDYRTDKENP